MRPILIFLLLFLSAQACEKNGQVLIRLENRTGKDFTSVLVDAGGNEQTYPALADGERSAYKPYAAAYRYGFVQAITITGDTLFVQPIDYVGESHLDGGHYTYVLTLANPDSRFMGITLEED
jgi:hypothetical protein